MVWAHKADRCRRRRSYRRAACPEPACFRRAALRLNGYALCTLHLFSSRPLVKHMWRSSAARSCSVPCCQESGYDNNRCEASASGHAGANVGLFSLQASIMAGPHGRVFAVEALPPTHRALVENVATWQRQTDLLLAPIDAHNYAVSCVDNETVGMTFFPNASGWGTMAPDMKAVMTGAPCHGLPVALTVWSARFEKHAQHDLMLHNQDVSLAHPLAGMLTFRLPHPRQELYNGGMMLG
jgi:FkbM family methyltransferase